MMIFIRFPLRLIRAHQTEDQLKGYLDSNMKTVLNFISKDLEKFCELIDAVIFREINKSYCDDKVSGQSGESVKCFITRSKGFNSWKESGD